MTRLLVIGGGASGVLVSAAADRHPEIDEVVVVERTGRAGPGLAYGAAASHHRLNSPAGRMGAHEDDPGGFVRWSAGTTTPQTDADFSPRRLYGDYLAAVLAGLPTVVVERAEAIDLAATDQSVVVRLADGRDLAGDAAVLALGNPPPAGRGIGAPATVADPWAPGALDGVDGRVLLVGTGLTTVDVATAIARRSPEAVMTAASRGMLLPRVHLDSPQPAGPGLTGTPTSLGTLVDGVRSRIRAGTVEGRPWQAEVDGIRPQVDRLWAALPHADRVRYLGHVSRRWEVHRHRMSGRVAAELQALLDDQRLALARPTGRFDAVIDCSGPRAFATAGWSTLVDRLLGSGTARPDALGIGLDVTPDGRLRTAAGRAAARLFVVGPARRGSQWETTAIPEIRRQAGEISALVAASG